MRNDISEEKIDSPDDVASGVPEGAALATMSPPDGIPPPPSEANTTLVVAPDAVGVAVVAFVDAGGEFPRTDCWRTGAPAGAAEVAPADEASVMSPAADGCIVGAHPANAIPANASESTLYIAVRV